MEDMLPQVVSDISHVNSAGVCVCVCACACVRATLDKFQMSGSVMNKIKIRMCSGCMQNHRALVFHRIS